MFKKLFSCILLCSANIIFSQKNIQLVEIPEQFKEQANSVIREQSINVEIKSISQMKIKTHKVVTVFNVAGLKNIDAVEHYDKSHSVDEIQAVVYNKFGFEIKKIKRKDFYDYSASGDAGEVLDTRVLALKYTPTEYPFTIVYDSEITTINTAFIPSWYPVDDYYESVLKSEYQIVYPKDLGFKYKVLYDTNFPFQKTEISNGLKFSAENIQREKPEELSDKKFFNVIFGLDKFSLENVEGTATSWKDFGAWMNEKLLKGRSELPEATLTKIRSLVAGVNDPLEKARIVYEYMQNKTRYISIQLGIGGWRPMLAKDVDRLGYGDCKALSNYTKALLDAVGVESYYTIIYGGSRKNILDDFVSMQGNHAVLAIPHNGKYVMLECTSQKQAFGFEGDFTDDRMALIIKPEGGEVIKTNEYINNTNGQFLTSKVFINELGETKVEAEIKYTGIQYNSANEIESLKPEKINEEILSRYGDIIGLSVQNYKCSNNKKTVEFTEKFQLTTSELVKAIGNEKMFAINLLNKNKKSFQRYRARKTNFKEAHGFCDEDVIDFELTKNFKITYLPENIKLETKFGKYETEIVKLDETKFRYKRKFILYKGEYSAEEYENFRQFNESVSKNDNAKIILN